MRTSSLFWLLVLGNFETLGSKFRHETARAAAVLCYYIEKSNSFHTLILHPLKQKRLLIAVCVTAATLVATVTRKL